jgi:hypothetical protein
MLGPAAPPTWPVGRAGTRGKGRREQRAHTAFRCAAVARAGEPGRTERSVAVPSPSPNRSGGDDAIFPPPAPHAHAPLPETVLRGTRGGG